MSTIIGAVDARFCIDILFAIPLLSERICCNTKSVKETVFLYEIRLRSNEKNKHRSPLADVLGPEVATGTGTAAAAAGGGLPTTN